MILYKINGEMVSINSPIDIKDAINSGNYFKTNPTAVVEKSKVDVSKAAADKSKVEIPKVDVSKAEVPKADVHKADTHAAPSATSGKKMRIETI